MGELKLFNTEKSKIESTITPEYREKLALIETDLLKDFNDKYLEDAKSTVEKRIKEALGCTDSDARKLMLEIYRKAIPDIPKNKEITEEAILSKKAERKERIEKEGEN